MKRRTKNFIKAIIFVVIGVVLVIIGTKLSMDSWYMRKTPGVDSDLMPTFFGVILKEWVIPGILITLGIRLGLRGLDYLYTRWEKRMGRCN